MKLVSVIIPAYNFYNKLFNIAISSVFKQTYKNIEIIIVNNDNNIALLNINNIGNIKCVCQKYTGISDAINTGIENSNGDYICWLSNDNFFLRYKIQHQIELFSKVPDLGIVFSDAYIVDDSNYVLFLWESSYDKNLSMTLNLIKSSFIQRSTIMFSRKCLEDVGPFNTKFYFSPELEWLLKASEKYEFGYLNYPTVKLFIKSRNRYLRPEVINEEKEIINEFLSTRTKDYTCKSNIIAFTKCFIKRGLILESKDILERNLSNNKGPELYQLLGISYFYLNNYTSAISMLKRALILGDNTPDTHYYLGRSYELINLYDLALYEYSITISINPNYSSDVYCYYAILLYNKGEIEKAREYFIKASDLTPIDKNILIEAGKFNIKNQEWKIAFDLFDRLSAILPYHDEIPEVNYYKGECMFHLKKYDFAVGLLTLALESYQTPDSFNLTALAMEKYGWNSYAEIIFKIALKKFPHDLNLQKNYADLMIKLGKYEEALSYYFNFLNKFPESKEIHNTLFDLQLKTNNFQPIEIEGKRGFNFLIIINSEEIIKTNWLEIIEIYIESFSSLDDVSLILVCTLEENLIEIENRLNDFMKTKEYDLEKVPDILLIKIEDENSEFLRLFLSVDVLLTNEKENIKFYETLLKNNIKVIENPTKEDIKELYSKNMTILN